MGLNRRFTPIVLLMLSLNGMIGSAWLFAPLYAAKLAGAGAIFAWIIGGLATTLIALTFVELSVMFPVAGGTAQIPQLSHGILTSFILSWIAWLSSLMMAPVEVQAVLQYASTYFPSITHVVNGEPSLSHVGFMYAAILMILLCVINLVSFKGLVRFNFLLFTFKVGVILLTIVLLIKTRFHPQNFILDPSGSHHTDWQSILSAVAAGGIAFAFTGFKHGVELAGETTHSRFALPLAIVGSIFICLILYLGLQIAFIGSLDPAHLVNGWKHVSFAGDVGPFAGLAAALGLIWLLKLLYVDAAISPLGAGLIFVTSTARILYAMSQLGFVPKAFSKLNKQKFPIVAIITNFIIGMILFLPLPGWQAMMSLLISGMIITYAMGPIAVLCLRLELPQEKRLFKLPAVNLLCVLAFYCCNLMSYWTGWETISKLAIAVLVGFIFFFIACVRGKIKASNLGIKSGLWVCPYLLGLFIISYLGSFGGKNVIPFGWDFLIIAIFSVAILYLAVRSRAMIIPSKMNHSLEEMESLNVV